MAYINTTGETPDGQSKPIPISGTVFSFKGTVASGANKTTGWFETSNYDALGFVFLSDKSGNYTIEYSEDKSILFVPMITVSYTGANYAMPSNKTLCLFRKSDKWYEINRSVDVSGISPFLSINGLATTNRDLSYLTNGISRFIFRVNSAAESGSDAGSNFELLSRTDGGGFKSSILTIYRLTGGINIGSGPDKLSAAFAITSTTKGFLKPIMTTVQRDAIVTPDQGIELYNSNTAKTEYFNGVVWRKPDLGELIIDATTAIHTTATLNAAYPNARSGDKVVQDATNKLYIKKDESPTGAWTFVGVQTGTTSGAASLSVDINKEAQVFTGTTATWTWAPVANNLWKRIFIKNRGTGNLTINSNAGGNDFYLTAPVNTLTVAAGTAIILINDGTYWSVN